MGTTVRREGTLRGRITERPLAAPVLVTVHLSFVLRLRGAEQAAEFASWQAPAQYPHQKPSVLWVVQRRWDEKREPGRAEEGADAHAHSHGDAESQRFQRHRAQHTSRAIIAVIQ